MPEERNLRIPEQPPLKVSAEEAKAGERLYNKLCMSCHGLFAVSSGVIPDLRMLTTSWHEAMKDIVLDGGLKPKGMPAFSHLMTEQDLELIRGYIVKQANEGRDKAADSTINPAPR